MNNIDQLYSETADDITSFAKGYLRYLTQLLSQLNCDEVAEFIRCLMDARQRGARIFFIGNGGSAATASHFANDIAIGSRSWGQPYRATAFTDNVPVITAIGNDYGYDDIFLLQLKINATPGDILVAISASGNSSNLIRAVEYANEHEITTVGLTGFNGGALKPLCKVGVHIQTPHGEYGPVEDIHMVLDHLTGSYLLKHSSSNA